MDIECGCNRDSLIIKSYKDETPISTCSTVVVGASCPDGPRRWDQL
jgi:hypothetical protein